MRAAFARYFIASIFISTLATAAVSEGPDVVVGFVEHPTQIGEINNGLVGLSAATTSCNVGTDNLNWYQLPDNRHPVIALNLYMLGKNGRMEQVGQSWVKHGFFATNEDLCRGQGIPGISDGGCPRIDNEDGQVLRPQCGDPYDETLNAREDMLGPRSKINPTSGAFGADAQDLSGYPPSTAAQRIITADEAALMQQGARFFIEAQYIASDDSTSGHSLNNVTYREMRPTKSGNRWRFDFLTPQLRFIPAIRAWEGAKFADVEGIEQGAKAKVVVAYKVTPIEGKFRYDYAVYNMNSDLGVGSLSIPAAGLQSGSEGFKAAKSSGEIWSNDPWTAKTAGNAITWSAEPFATSPKANAIRWGTTYNFWFVSDAAPTQGKATLGRFKTANDAGSPETVSVDVEVPGS